MTPFFISNISSYISYLSIHGSFMHVLFQMFPFTFPLSLNIYFKVFFSVSPVIFNYFEPHLLHNDFASSFSWHCTSSCFLDFWFAGSSEVVSVFLFTLSMCAPHTVQWFGRCLHPHLGPHAEPIIARSPLDILQFRR